MSNSEYLEERIAHNGSRVHAQVCFNWTEARHLMAWLMQNGFASEMMAMDGGRFEVRSWRS